MQWARHRSPTGWVPLETSRGRQYPHWTQYFLEQTRQMEDYAMRDHQGFPVGSRWCQLRELRTGQRHPQTLPEHQQPVEEEKQTGKSPPGVHRTWNHQQSQ